MANIDGLEQLFVLLCRTLIAPKVPSSRDADSCRKYVDQPRNGGLDR